MAHRSKAARKAARNRIDRKVLTREKLHARDMAVQLFKDRQIIKAVLFAVLSETGSTTVPESTFNWITGEMPNLDYSVERIGESDVFSVNLEKRPQLEKAE